jgi:hypothetical protein
VETKQEAEHAAGFASEPNLMRLLLRSPAARVIRSLRPVRTDARSSFYLSQGKSLLGDFGLDLVRIETGPGRFARLQMNLADEYPTLRIMGRRQFFPTWRRSEATQAGLTLAKQVKRLL